MTLTVCSVPGCPNLVDGQGRCPTHAPPRIRSSPPWSGSTRRRRLPKNWALIRARVLRRDDHRCTWMDHGRRCPNPATDVDHLRPGDDHGDHNLRALCAQHHARKSSAEGNAARRLRSTR